MDIERIKDQYSPIYVTVVSIFLGLALEDLLSVFRESDKSDIVIWLTSIVIAFLILNAWIAYASLAISVRLVPVPLDAVNVFVMALSIFALNSLVGQPVYQFCFAIAFFNLGAIAATRYNLSRSIKDPDSFLRPRGFWKLSMLNLLIFLIYLFLAYYSWQEKLSREMEIGVLILSVLPPLIWIILYWKIWSSQQKEARDAIIED